MYGFVGIIEEGYDMLDVIEGWEGPSVPEMGGVRYYAELVRLEGKKDRREVALFVLGRGLVVCKNKTKGNRQCVCVNFFSLCVFLFCIVFVFLFSLRLLSVYAFLF